MISVGKEELVSHYENLRLQALGGGLSREMGLAVLLREGMGNWIELWSRCLPPPKSIRVGSTGTAAHSFPVELQGEIASILAGMTLSYGWGRSTHEYRDPPEGHC